MTRKSKDKLPLVTEEDAEAFVDHYFETFPDGSARLKVSCFHDYVLKTEPGRFLESDGTFHWTGKAGFVCSRCGKTRAEEEA